MAANAIGLRQRVLRQMRKAFKKKEDGVVDEDTTNDNGGNYEDRLSDDSPSSLNSQATSVNSSLTCLFEDESDTVVHTALYILLEHIKDGGDIDQVYPYITQVLVCMMSSSKFLVYKASEVLIQMLQKYPESHERLIELGLHISLMSMLENAPYMRFLAAQIILRISQLNPKFFLPFVVWGFCHRMRGNLHFDSLDQTLCAGYLDLLRTNQQFYLQTPVATELQNWFIELRWYERAHRAQDAALKKELLCSEATS